MRFLLLFLVSFVVACGGEDEPVQDIQDAGVLTPDTNYPVIVSGPITVQEAQHVPILDAGWHRDAK